MRGSRSITSRSERGINNATSPCIDQRAVLLSLWTQRVKDRKFMEKAFPIIIGLLHWGRKKPPFWVKHGWVTPMSLHDW